MTSCKQKLACDKSIGFLNERYFNLNLKIFKNEVTVLTVRRNSVIKPIYRKLRVRSMFGAEMILRSAFHAPHDLLFAEAE